MRTKKRTRAALAMLVAATVTLASGCAYDTYRPGPYARSSVYYRPGYLYDYHYYPSTQVYFHIYSGYYYYRPYRTWLRVRKLPPHIYLGPGERIHLRIRSARPYFHHDVHRDRFRPHPRFRRDRDRNRYERRYNLRHHHDYMKRYRR